MEEIKERNLRKERIGVVVSNKMLKTIVVAEKRKVKHAIYGKFVNKNYQILCPRRIQYMQHWRYCEDYGNTSS